MLHWIERNLHPPSCFPENDLPPNYAWPRAKAAGIIRPAKSLPRRLPADISSATVSSSAGKPITENTSFHDLEADLLTMIFRHICEKELSRSVCGVCRHWYRVARDPRLWKKLEFKAEKTETITMCNLLRKCPNLEYLSLNSMNDPATVIRQMCRSNRTIKNLKIKNCRGGESESISDSVLRNILHSCRYLVSLNLQGTQFSSTRFYHELANLSMLRELNLSDNKHLHAKNLVSIALNCRNLESISITSEHGSMNSLNITDQDVVFFFKTLSNSLRRVEFDTTGLGAQSFQAILSCPNLEHLSLSHALLLTGDIFRSRVSKLRYLKRLRLTHACQLLSNDFVFLDKIHAFDHLDLIDLTGCSRICDIGLKTVLLSCKNKLTYLSLKSCKSMSDLNIVTDNCPKLRYLNIAHAFAPHSLCIENIPLKIPKLKKLVVDTKTISNCNLTMLRTKAPRLTMIRSMSEFHRDEAAICSNKDSN